MSNESEELLTIKGVLEHYFSEQLGEGASEDIAEEIQTKVQRLRLAKREFLEMEILAYIHSAACGATSPIAARDKILALMPTDEDIRKQERERVRVELEGWMMGVGIGNEAGLPYDWGEEWEKFWKSLEGGKAVEHDGTEAKEKP